MKGMLPAALMLSLALVVWPSSPRFRLRSVGLSRRRLFRVNAWWGGCVLVCVAVTVATMLPLTTVLAVALVGATMTLRYRRHRQGRRAMAEGRALHTAIEVLVSELRVGAHPVHAFGVAAEEAGGLAGAGMRAVAVRARLGADVATGLQAVSQSSALPAQWNRLAVYWRLANEHGLSIATLMHAAQRDIVEQQRFSEKLIADTAGARATAAILTGLPMLGVLLGQLIGAQPLRFLLGGHAGGWLLVVGLTLACGGLLWCDRITDRCTP